MPDPKASALAHFSSYIGLWVALTLAVVCNSYLDIAYGTFGLEFAFWAVVFALTLRLGWRQRDGIDEAGRQGQKMVLIVGSIFSVLIFLPMWGLPRAGVAVLAMLQAGQNCVMVSRRQLGLGLLVSAVLVMFAASHYRADWTMLFYLVPYVAAVAFTLVSEQVNRRTREVHRDSLGSGSPAGQGVAVFAATMTILVGGALLYALTPQVSRPYLAWKFGQPAVGLLGKTTDAPGRPSSGSSAGTDGSEGAGQEPALAERDWPTAQEMRAAADRPGMPGWQAGAIRKLADVSEVASLALKPIRAGLGELWSAFKEWLQKHRQQLAWSLLGLLILALLAAMWLLLKEARPVAWLRSRFDYLRLGVFAGSAQGNAGAIEYYEALQRLLDLYDCGRSKSTNAREYLAQIRRRHALLDGEATEITSSFEQARYGREAIAPEDLRRVRQSYRRIFSLAAAGQSMG